MILRNITIKDCCGCSVCNAVCPTKAIHMDADELGFFYPSINDTVCVECECCVAVCPVINKHLLANNKYLMKSSYAGYIKDAKKLSESASGGAAAALSEQIISKGGVVFGVEYDNHLMPVWGFANNTEEVSRFKGSKYAESIRRDIFKTIQKEVITGKPVLVIGLPCDIAAIRMFLGETSVSENLFMCELICSRATSQKVLKESIRVIEERERKKVVSLSLRHKKNGIALPSFVRYTFNDGSELCELSTESDFLYAFCFIVRESCYNCSFKNNNSVADLRLGDYWGLNKSHSYYNPYGTSLIISCSNQGDKLMQFLNRNEFFIEETDLTEACAYNFMTIESFNKDSFSDTYITEFLANGFHSARKAIIDLQARNLSDISKDIDFRKDNIALWGIGNAADILYKKLKMSEWNIRHVFDSSSMKIGLDFNGYDVKNIYDIMMYSDEIDVVATTISSVPESELVLQVEQLGFNGKVVYLGQLRV